MKIEATLVLAVLTLALATMASAVADESLRKQAESGNVDARLKRVFAVDIETCPDCGGTVRVAAPAHPAPAALVRPCTS